MPVSYGMALARPTPSYPSRKMDAGSVPISPPSWVSFFANRVRRANTRRAPDIRVDKTADIFDPPDVGVWSMPFVIQRTRWTSNSLPCGLNRPLWLLHVSGRGRPELNAPEPPLVRVQDAPEGFMNSPLARRQPKDGAGGAGGVGPGLPAIEGGDLAPEATGRILDLPAEQIKAERELRACNGRLRPCPGQRG